MCRGDGGEQTIASEGDTARMLTKLSRAIFSVSARLSVIRHYSSEITRSNCKEKLLYFIFRLESDVELVASGFYVTARKGSGATASTHTVLIEPFPNEMDVFSSYLLLRNHISGRVRQAEPEPDVTEQSGSSSTALLAPPASPCLPSFSPPAPSGCFGVFVLLANMEASWQDPVCTLV